MLPANIKLVQPSHGSWSSFCTLHIKRSADSTVTIENKKYCVSTDGHRYYYHSRYTPKITTDTSCHHITDLPPDSCSKSQEYFYSYFYDRFAEYIARFEDGDIRVTANLAIGARAIYTPNNTTSTSKKRSLPCNCPTKGFTALPTTNPAAASKR